MCIIAYRPENKKISTKTLETMFENNPDGAGIMYAENGKITIIKGLMTKSAFLAACEVVPDNVPCVYHCRIATHGTVRGGTCHPFPVTSDEKLLNETMLVLNKGYAVAHNGVISGMNCARDFSDSQAFTRDILSPLSKMRSLHSKTLKLIIEKSIDHSRLCILDTRGRVSLFGSGWSVDNGIFYSNTSYKPVVYHYTASAWHWDKKRKAYVNAKGKTWAEVVNDEYETVGIQQTLASHGWEDSF